jgi:hypothetical protein
LTGPEKETEGMLFLMLVNAVLCEIAMYVELVDANTAYGECLRTAQGTTGDQECYTQLAVAVGELSLKYVDCLF